MQPKTRTTVRATTEGSVQLRDGRTLAWAAYGKHDAAPVLFLPGIGHGRRACHPQPALTERAQVRVMCIDRPGTGASTPDPQRTLSSLAGDVAQVADRCRIERFPILGWSGGGPYALAVAAALGSRVSAVTVASGMPVRSAGAHPSDVRARVLLAAARRTPPMVRAPLAALRLQACWAPRALPRLLYAFPPASDRQLLFDHLLADMLAGSLHDAASGTTRGLAVDLRLIAGEWDFDPARIACPVRWVTGTDDRLVPARAAVASARGLGAAVEVLPNEGHLLVWRHWSRLLGELAHRASACGERTSNFTP